VTKKHIYIYSPSGDVEVDIDALSSFQRFAGDDEVRLAAIHRAAASGADVAMISRGGYGITRILPNIRYKAVAKAIDKGTQFVGISDFTAFQLALLAKTGQVSWAGPAVGEAFGALPQPDDIMEDCFQDMMLGQGEGTGWRQLPSDGVTSVKIHNAPLWGGNLAIITSLLGTPYFPTIKGGVLFLEDVGEHPYRIERMLTQLLNAGVLSRQKAIVLGQFTEFKLSSHDKGFKLTSVVKWLQSKLNTPILTNLPFGHVATKVLLPVGATVDLVSEGRDAMLVWGHI